MKRIIAAVVLLYLLPLVYSRTIEFFRKDYTYVEEFDAFYKVHWDVSDSWNAAFLTCDNEQATFFYPKAQDEWMLVKNLTEKMTDIYNVTEILIGLHDQFKLGEFITVDGHPVPFPITAEGSLSAHRDNCITMNIDNGKFNVGSCSRTKNTPLPFVCKKVDEQSCPTIDHEYKFLKTLQKCYKINKNPKPWQEAMRACFMEGGMLAVIEHHVQAEEIKDMIERTEKYFVGVRNLSPQGNYYTVTGRKSNDYYQHSYDSNSYESRQFPDERGFLPDENGQYPDENGEYPVFNPHMSDKCGIVHSRGGSYLYTDVEDCVTSLPFICEMQLSV